MSESDGGIYTCAAINPAGEALESTLVKVTGGTGMFLNWFNLYLDWFKGVVHA